MACITHIPETVTFIHNPKAAGMSIARWMELHARGRSIYPRHALAKDLNQDLGWTFCVVRHPWTLFLSRYKFVIQRTKIFVDYLEADSPGIMPKEVGVAFRDGWLTDSTFTIEVQKNKLVYMRENFLEYCKEHVLFNQTQYSEGCNYTIKYENLNEEFKIVQDRLNVFQPLPHINKSDHIEINNEQEAKDIIFERYKEQAKLLGYII